jgi:hypothetical protein
MLYYSISVVCFSYKCNEVLMNKIVTQVFTTIANYYLWKIVEEGYDVPPLPNNPTMTYIKIHKKKKTKKSKAKACLFNFISNIIFIRILSLKSANDV